MLKNVFVISKTTERFEKLIEIISRINIDTLIDQR